MHKGYTISFFKLLLLFYVHTVTWIIGLESYLVHRFGTIYHDLLHNGNKKKENVMQEML